MNIKGELMLSYLPMLGKESCASLSKLIENIWFGSGMLELSFNEQPSPCKAKSEEREMVSNIHTLRIFKT